MLFFAKENEWTEIGVLPENVIFFSFFFLFICLKVQAINFVCETIASIASGEVVCCFDFFLLLLYSLYFSSV